MSTISKLHVGAGVALAVTVVLGVWWAVSLYSYGVYVDENGLVGTTRASDVVLALATAAGLIVTIVLLVRAARASR